MAKKEKAEGMLSPYRALDLANETGYLCGKLLGDLGADVIKIERPGGDPGRSLGPFYHDEADPEKSLFWFAYNNNKRGITLDIETADGRELFKKLVKTADWVIETFPPGYLDKLGLGYSALEKLNPGIILVSITPFGQTGPWKDYKAPDIVAWGLGGQMYAWGYPDRAPLRISHHSHAHLFTSACAAVGAVMALYHRRMTGEGQQIDASILESAAQATAAVSWTWEREKRNKRRGEPVASGGPGAIRGREFWTCKDGQICCTVYSASAQGKARNLSFARWLEDEGFADDFTRGFNWDTFEAATTTQAIIDRLEEPVAKFFMSQTKNELFDKAAKYDAVELYPIQTTKEVLESTQLAARKFFVEVEHPELGASILYPGAFAQTSEVSPEIARRAPLIGEHNQGIYEGELGISKEELVILKQAKVI